jgi:hypothetical protein
MAASTDNYYIGKGVVSIKHVGTSVWVDLGNVPEIEFTPELETLEHFSSRAGTRTKDKTVVIEKKGTLRIVLEEWTIENLLLAVIGTENSDGTIQIFDTNAVECQVRFVGANEVGNTFTWLFNKVEFIPSAGIGLISDEWGQIELTGNVSADGSGEFGTITET